MRQYILIVLFISSVSSLANISCETIAMGRHGEYSETKILFAKKSSGDYDVKYQASNFKKGTQDVDLIMLEKLKGCKFNKKNDVIVSCYTIDDEEKTGKQFSISKIVNTNAYSTREFYTISMLEFSWTPGNRKLMLPELREKVSEIKSNIKSAWVQIPVARELEVTVDLKNCISE